jgi:intracellular septation protein A
VDDGPEGGRPPAATQAPTPVVTDGRTQQQPPAQQEPSAQQPPPAQQQAGQWHWILGRVRQLAMILIFDLAGPLIIYSVLRSDGMSAVAALIISGVSPGLGIIIGALVDRRLDIIGVVVLGGLVVGTVAGLVSHNARLYLVEGAVPSLVFALACLGSLRTSKPLIYRFAVELLGLDTQKGREVISAWQYRGFRRAFAVITLAWGVAYLVEVAARLVVIEIVSTGPALLFSKLVPYACAICLSIWTLGYGEHEKAKAERQAAAADGDPGTTGGGAADGKR